MPERPPSIKQISRGNVDGKNIYLFTLTNGNGDVVKISNYGGTIVSWMTRDKNDQFNSIVLGFDALNEYRTSRAYFGTLVGRYANRIAGAQFKIGSQTYMLTSNDGLNHCHGGDHGFDQAVWEPSIDDGNRPVLHLRHVSKDGEEGYPGTLIVNVTYLLKADGLSISYRAETDKPTIVNLTNHSYFNLTGDRKSSIENHTLTLNADCYTPVNEDKIPTGEIEPVSKTIFNFSNERVLGDFFDSSRNGLDMNFVLNQTTDYLYPGAILIDPVSQRKLEVFTTEPGLQVFTGKENINASFYNSICLETQHFPNSPNQPNFPSTLLMPGEVYRSYTFYKLSFQHTDVRPFQNLLLQHE